MSDSEKVVNEQAGWVPECTYGGLSDRVIQFAVLTIGSTLYRYAPHEAADVANSWLNVLRSALLSTGTNPTPDVLWRKANVAVDA